eukprot:7386314-Prymnesium_polylepis.1
MKRTNPETGPPLGVSKRDASASLSTATARSSQVSARAAQLQQGQLRLAIVNQRHLLLAARRTQQKDSRGTRNDAGSCNTERSASA